MFVFAFWLSDILTVSKMKVKEVFFSTFHMLQSALKELDTTRSQLSKCLQENAELKQMLAAVQENQRKLEVLL